MMPPIGPSHGGKGHGFEARGDEEGGRARGLFANHCEVMRLEGTRLPAAETDRRLLEAAAGHDGEAMLAYLRTSWIRS